MQMSENLKSLKNFCMHTKTIFEPCQCKSENCTCPCNKFSIHEHNYGFY